MRQNCQLKMNAKNIAKCVCKKNAFCAKSSLKTFLAFFKLGFMIFGFLFEKITRNLEIDNP
jgi:hypothetical protein